MNLDELDDIARKLGFETALSVRRIPNETPSICVPEYLKILMDNECLYRTEVGNLHDGLRKACARAHAWLLTETV